MLAMLWKKCIYFIVLFYVLVKVGYSQTSKSYSQISIDKNWQFKLEDDSVWLSATVPGCVHTDLLKNQKIEDPFFGMNEKKLQWIDKKNWVYQTSFFVNKDVYASKNKELHFKGLDTYATVILNTDTILQADNMFREWHVNIQNILKAGTNKLTIVFKSPIKIGLQKLAEFGYNLPANNDQSENGEIGDQKVSVFTRKAGYHYGWDWGPRFVTSGIWRPINLVYWNSVKIDTLNVIQKNISEKNASIKACLNLKIAEEKKYQIKLKINDGTFIDTTYTVFLKKGNHSFYYDINIPNPKLWWTNCLGKPHLYKVIAQVFSENQLMAERDVTIGLRTIQIVQKPDSLGKSFYVALNGIPVFMKGANYIPSDVFLDRIKPQDYEKIIKLAVDANMNMLRVWGGGIYENDIFYDLCDKNGLLVWQDFMFACSMYPGDTSFLNNVKKEAIDNVCRLRNHPSIALWCGNNEIDVAWSKNDEQGGWGWKQLYNQKQREQIWKAYDTIFHQILPQVISTYDSSRFYWSSSPMADIGKHATYETKSGDIHYWGVWHGLHKFSDFEKYIGRFMSEYGFQSFPELKTIKSFTIPQDWNIESPVMTAHQRSGIGNLRIKEYMGWYYNIPTSFEKFLYVGQILQADAIKSAIETHRINKPFTMGTLYWQLNDCWPVASWSSTDYYRRWKALHYFVKKAYSEFLVTTKIADNKLNISVVSDKLSTTKASLLVVIKDFQGNEFFKKNLSVQIPENSSNTYLSINLNELKGDFNQSNCFCYVELSKGNNLLANESKLLTIPKQANLPKCTIQSNVTKAKGGVNILLKSNVFAKNVYLSTESEVQMADNYFDLLPNQPKNIFMKTKFSVEQIKEQLKVICLNNL